MTIRQIKNNQEKQVITRQILEALPEWFGIPEAREDYIKESADQWVLAAYDDDSLNEASQAVAFLNLKATGKDTLELYVMGVLKDYHRQGLGKVLVLKAQELARQEGYSFLQVKTVQMGKYDSYDKTNAFYLSLGFKEFEVFPDLWDEWNPCQIYVMAL